MIRGWLVLMLAIAALVSEAQAPHNFTAYDFLADMTAQCIEDAECSTDTDCMEAEDACTRAVLGGRI